MLTEQEIRRALGALPPVESTRADAARWVIRTARRLAATGLPISEETNEVTEWLDQFSQIQRDEHDNVVGVAGLTLIDTGIRLDIGSTNLHTWCAADALFFPRVLKADEFTIRARCASSGRAVWIRGREGSIDACSPPCLMISLPIPSDEKAPVEKVGDRYGPAGSLCAGSHFLVDPNWGAHPVVPVRVGWRIAQSVWADPLIRAAGLAAS